MEKKNGLVWIISMTMMIMLAACSSESLLIGDQQNIDAKTEIQSSSDEFIDVSVNLPDMGRGWDVAKYSVTATKSGEDPVTQETTSSSLSMRLKIGNWTFVASAYDSNDNLIYKSAERTYEVTASGANISIFLDQQSAAMKVSVGTSTPNAVKNTIDRVVVTATPSVSGFDTVTGTSTSWDQSITLTGLLANSSYILQVSGYRGDILYGQCNSFAVTADTIATIYDAGSKVLTQKKVTPVSFSKTSGSSFSSSTKIELSCATSSVSYYYTTDGTDPTTSSTAYNSTTGIVVNSSWSSGKTVKVIATKSGLEDSEIASAFYSFGAGIASTPSFSKAGGTYSADITVALTNNETSGTLKYSLNGSTWSNYSSPIAVAGNGTTKTIYAKVVDVTDKEDSAVLSQTYTISYSALGAVTISPSAGQYFSTQAFTLAAPIDGADIYYTTDGSTPTTSSTHYTAPFTLSPRATPYTIKAICVKSGYADSEAVNLGSFTIIEDTSVTLTQASNLLQNTATSVWVTNGLIDLKKGNNVFVATGLTAGKTYELKWLKSSLTPTITIYKNDLNTSVTATSGSGKYTFSTTGASSSDRFYFFLNMGSAANGVLLGLGQENTVKPVTALTITPSSVSGLYIGSTQEFSVSYTPSDANMGTDVNWTVSNSSVLSISGSTITAIGSGTSRVTVATTFTGGPSKYINVNIGSTVGLTVTVPDWIWNDDAVIFAWVWGEGNSGEWVSVSGSSTSATFSIAPTTVGFNMVRCAVGTTTPDWTIASGDGAGRIYNKCGDVTFTAGTTAYDTSDSWVSYGSVDTMIATTYNTYSGQDIYFGYRIYDGNGTEIQEWTTVAGTYTGEGDGYNWYAMIPGVTNGVTISWKAFMRENGNDSWMTGDNRSTPIGTNQISAW